MELKDQIWQTLKSIPYPGYSRDIVSFGLVPRVAACDGQATISLAVADLPPETQQQITDAVAAAVRTMPEVKKVRIEVAPPPAAPGKTRQPPATRGAIRQVITVGSGKGGVGKSTVAVNLAVALAQMGLRVGLIDADVYGPNIPRMAGIAQAPQNRNGKMVPVEAYGVKIISIGLLVEQDKPVVWRGPMTDKLIRQFVSSVDWGELDALVVDLPPGTGDIAMSVAQHLQPDGAVVVVTPQAVALDDARKAVGMFERLQVPVLGVVENMSYFVCDQCAKHHDLFGQGGGRRLAAEMDVPFLGEVPFEPRVGAGGDDGTPAILQPGSQAGAALRAIAERIWRTQQALVAAEVAA